MCKDRNGKVRFSTMDMISSGRTGQTSATGTAGVILCFLAVVVIISLMVMYFIDQNEAGNILAFFDKITIVLGIGAALLGTRKISGVIASKSASNVIDLVEDTVHNMESVNKKSNVKIKRRDTSIYEYDDEGEVCNDNFYVEEQYKDNFENMPDTKYNIYADNSKADENVEN